MKKRKSPVATLLGLLTPSPPSLRGLLHAANSFHEVDVDWQPGAERVVVLAPHMDDEVLGCGGAIALHKRAGAHVTVVFLTDGRQGSSSLAGLMGQALRDAGIRSWWPGRTRRRRRRSSRRHQQLVINMASGRHKPPGNATSAHNRRQPILVPVGFSLRYARHRRHHVPT